jgi:hypothetical protein
MTTLIGEAHSTQRFVVFGILGGVAAGILASSGVMDLRAAALVASVLAALLASLRPKTIAR